MSTLCYFRCSTFCVQVAQQDAQRASFYVEKAIQEKQQKIVQSEGEAAAAKLISFYHMFSVFFQCNISITNIFTKNGLDFEFM